MAVDVVVLKDLIAAAIGAELEANSNLYPNLDTEYRGFIREDFVIIDLDGSNRFLVTSPWVFGGVMVVQDAVEDSEADQAGFRNTTSIRQAAIYLLATANDWRAIR